jgi:glycine/D-amino acid oxidase-like deaminating enzyme
LGPSTDLAIIGAGIVGLFTALHYRRMHPGQRAIILEAGPLPSGASVKNAGFACFGSPSELLHDIAVEGEAVALGRVEERWRGLLELRSELGDEAIGFEPVGGYELFRKGDPLHGKVADDLDELNRALHPIFGKTVFTWEDQRAEDLGLNAGHLSWNSLEGALDSGLLMRTLLRKVQDAGVPIRFNTGVVRASSVQDGAELALADGAILKVPKAIIAINGYSRSLVPGCDVLPARGQVVLTSVVKGLGLKGTFHMNEGYYYFREYAGRVLLGGGRDLDRSGETTSEDGVTPLIQNALEHLLRETILKGRSFTIEERWSGVMGFRSGGGPPLVEHVSPHVVMAAGLGGIGVAIGIRIARKAAELAASS